MKQTLVFQKHDPFYFLHIFKTYQIVWILQRLDQKNPFRIKNEITVLQSLHKKPFHFAKNHITTFLYKTILFS